MKICWGMLEGVYLTINGTFRKGSETYIYKESCIKCGEPYLAEKRRNTKFCSISCSSKDRGHSIEARKKISKVHTGKAISIEHREKLAKSMSKRVGVLSPYYKGGITKLGLTLYDNYKDTLSLYEDIRKQEDTDLLEVKCAYCGQWFTPTRNSANHRLGAINNLNKGEHLFYCSDNCKQACPTFGMRNHPKGFKKATSREVSTYLRQIVFERDNWECQKCGKTGKEVALHCHHIKGYAQNKILANDVDNCITLCKGCHKEVHKLPGCRYVDLRCK